MPELCCFHRCKSEYYIVFLDPTRPSVAAFKNRSLPVPSSKKKC